MLAACATASAGEADPPAAQVRPQDGRLPSGRYWVRMLDPDYGYSGSLWFHNGGEQVPARVG